MYHFRTGSQDRKFCIKKLSASSQEDITAMSGYFFIVFCPSDNGLDERVFVEASLSGAYGLWWQVDSIIKMYVLRGLRIMKKQQSGFTLIELMIVVAIIGILAAVALPAYQDYTIRAKMSEVVLAASSCRTTVSEIYQTGSGSAPSANAWGCESASATSKYVASVATNSLGKITVTIRGFGDTNIDNKTIDLVPTNESGTNLTASDFPGSVGGWKCEPGASTPIPSQYLPGSCR